MAQDKVRIRVGETVFVISRGTIANGGRQTLLASMTDPLWESHDALANSACEEDELFIDRDPTYFRVLLDLLRTGELRIPTGMSEIALFEEALYHGLRDQVRAAKSGPLDGDTMARSTVVPGYGRPPVPHGDLKSGGSMPMIRANADGGCCVSCDAVVRTYDWTLQQQAVMKYAPICDIAYMGTSRVLVGTIDHHDSYGIVPTGMACFDASSGAMLHQYRLRDDGDYRSFTAESITTSGGEHVYAACRYNNRYHEDDVAIGTWDQTTGQQVELIELSEVLGLPEPIPASAPGATRNIKLQWLSERNLVMMAVLNVRKGSLIWNFDLRTKRIAWPSDLLVRDV